MKIGVLDIGSNSAQLQVVEASPGAPPLPTHAVKHATRLSEEIQPDGSITSDGVERVIEAVESAVRAARSLQVDKLFAFATSAVRDASNCAEIADRLAREAGIQPRFLTGEEEARLTYLAVRRWYGWSAGRLLVLDIGGGSTEIALGRDARPDFAVSLPLGAGRLTRAFLRDDPPKRDELRELRRHARATLREVSDRLRWEGDPKRVIASSKTFKQLARMCGAPPQRTGPFVRRTLFRDDLATAVHRLSRMPARERAQLRGVSECRAKQLVAGALIAKATMDALDIKRLDISPWALREGVILHYLETVMNQEPPLALDALQPAQVFEPAAAPPSNVTVMPTS
ncbi:MULTISPECIES: Ppx/GppA phosphatase family protein [unclassified Kribbella]|uniref:Ppx/GppA phosphatase family protein n=1 Tax=unclassified Kribbella TaxID=2644121 RepID=UPI0033EA0B70